MKTATTPREQLGEIQAALADARATVPDLRKAAKQAHDAYKAQPTGNFRAAQETAELVKDREAEIKALEAKQVEILGQLGNHPNAPELGVAGDGWAMAATVLDGVSGGNLRVDMPARDILATAPTFKGPTPPLGAPSIQSPFVEKAADRRGLILNLQRVQLERGDLAIVEFAQKGARTVEGEVKRSPTAVTEKALLGLEVELRNPSVNQHAIIIPGVPSKLFDVEEALLGFLTNEGSYQTERSIEAEILAAITAAEPANGKVGTDLISRVRNAVAAMRAIGANPTILAVSPTVAAELDLTKTELGYVAGFRNAGSASPLFGLEIVEVPNIAAPTLIDPRILGVLYMGIATLLVDPYTGKRTNTVELRIELEALMHIRDASGAYEIR